MPEAVIHAITGASYSNTMRLEGWVNGVSVVILVDSGSSHNFLDPSVAKRARLVVDDSAKLLVCVANGVLIQNSGCCTNFGLRIQGTKFPTS